VERFIEGYEEARVLARRGLGDLFNDFYYPVGIRETFGFEWRYLALE